MLEALIHGKMTSDQENTEDILTSNVFGVLKYVSPNRGLLSFLSMAVLPDGTSPFADLPATAEYEFWPWWKEADCIGCEPDVVIRQEWPGYEHFRPRV